MSDENSSGRTDQDLEKHRDEIRRLVSEKVQLLENSKGSGTMSETPPKKNGESGNAEKQNAGGFSDFGKAAQNLKSGLRSLDTLSQQQSSQPAAPSQQAYSQPQRSGGSGESVTKEEISRMLNNKIDSKFSELSSDLNKLGKISEMESRLTQLTDQINMRMLQPPVQSTIPGEAIATGRQLASFGEQVDFQSQIFDLKKSISEINKGLEMLNKKMDYRVSNLEDKSKVLERVPDLEERLEHLNQKLGPENVQKLRKLIFSSDEIIDDVIPDLVNKRLKTKLDPAVNEVRDLRDIVNDFNVKLNHIKEEVLSLQKLREDISGLKADEERITKDMGEQDDKLADNVKILRDDIKGKIERVTERIYQDLKEMQKKEIERIDRDINKTFLSLVQPRFADVEKKNMLLEEKLKLAEKRESELYEGIKKIEAPENIKVWLDKRMSVLERGLQSDVNKLKVFYHKQTKMNETFRDNINTTWSETKTLPKRIDTQDITLAKFMDTRDLLMKRAETLASELNVISNKTSTNREDISGLNQRLTLQESKFSDITESQKKTIAKLSDEMRKDLKNEVSSIKMEMDKRREVESRKQLTDFKLEVKKIASLEEESEAFKKFVDRRLERIDDSLAMNKETLTNAATSIKVLSSRLADTERMGKDMEKRLADMIQYQKQRMDTVSDELRVSTEKRLKEIIKDVEDKRFTDKQEQMVQLKSEFKRMADIGQLLEVTKTSHETRLDSLRNEMTSLQSSLADLKFLKKRTDELGALNNTLDTKIGADRDKMTDQMSRLMSQISIIDKQIKDIRTLYGMLEQKINLDMKELEKALKQNVSDRKVLERDMLEQRDRMSSMIKELTS